MNELGGEGVGWGGINVVEWHNYEQTDPGSLEVELVDSRCLSPSVSISNHVVVACAPLGTYWVPPVLAVGRPWPSSSQPWSCCTSSTSCRGMVNS